MKRSSVYYNTVQDSRLSSSQSNSRFEHQKSLLEENRNIVDPQISLVLQQEIVKPKNFKFSNIIKKEEKNKSNKFSNFYLYNITEINNVKKNCISKKQRKPFPQMKFSEITTKKFKMKDPPGKLLICRYNTINEANVENSFENLTQSFYNTNETKFNNHLLKSK